MGLDALVLALASVIRLTSLAAVYAMLSAARPVRLLAAYIVAGFAFSAAVGIVLVILVGVPAGPQGPENVRAVIAFVLAAISLGYAAGLLVERMLRPRRDATGAAPGPESNSWLGPTSGCREPGHLTRPADTRGRGRRASLVGARGWPPSNLAGCRLRAVADPVIGEGGGC
jgi:hypothetical protein